MTKRWLSLLLVLMLAIPTFGMSALAIPGTPTVTIAAATTPDDGTKRITMSDSNSVVGCASRSIFYNYGTGTVADPTSASTKYSASFVVSAAGDYTIKAITYYFNSDGAYLDKSAIKTDTFSVNTALNSVKIDQQAVVITGNDSVIYTATVDPIAQKKNLDWTTTALPAGMTGEVQSDGSYKVTSGSYVGDFTITAKVGTETATSEGIVKAQKITDFDMPSTVTVAAGETVQITGSVKPANATNRNIEIDTDATKVSTTKVGLDAKTGVNTFDIVAGTTEGTDTITFVGYDDAAATPTPSLKRVVNVTVTAASSIPPKPVFFEGTPKEYITDGKVFTDDATHMVMVQANKDGVTTKVSLDEGFNWADALSSGYSVAPNASITIWAKNVVGTTESEIVKATISSKVAVVSVAFDTHVTETTGADTLEVEALVTPATAKDDSVVFTSSNEKVATIAYKTGDTTKRIATITPKAAGKTDIVATTTDGNKTAKYTLEVKDVKASKIDIYLKGTSHIPTTVNQNEYIELIAVAKDALDKKAFDQEVEWTVDKPTIATVANGKVVGISEGKALVTATYKADNLVVKTVEITVLPGGAVKKVVAPTVTFTDAATPYTKEQTVTMSTVTAGATIYYTLDKSDPLTSTTKIAYTAPFKLSGPKDGTIKSAAVKEGFTNSDITTTTFSFAIPVEKVVMDKTATVAKGSTIQMKAEVSNANATNKTITWSLTHKTGESGVARIDLTTGLLTALKAGTVRVTATSESTPSKSAVCEVTVTGDPVDSIVVFPDDLTGTMALNLYEEQQLQYRATFVTKTIAGATWASSDPTIVAVSNTGILTAKKAGEATITVTLDGKTATVKVTVNADPVNIPVKPAAPTYEATTKEFNGTAKGTLSAVIGKVKPATGTTLDQLFYYYNIKVTTATQPDEVNFSVNKQTGEITMNIANLPTASFFFSYTVQYVEKRVSGASPVTINTIDGNVVTIAAIPDDVITFEGGLLEPIIGVASELDKTVTLGTVTNYADLKTKGYTLTATASETDAAFKAAIDDKGVVTLAVKAPKAGEYSVTVTLGGKSTTKELKAVTTGAVKVTATELGIKVENAIIGKVEMVETETWSENVAQVTNLAVLDAAKYVVSVEPYVTVIDNGVATTVVKDWTAAIDALGNITLTATKPAPGTYEASVKVMAATADAVSAKLADVYTTAIPFTVTEEATDADIVVASGLYAYNAKGELCLAKSQLSGVKFVLTNGRTATWKTNNKVIAISGDGSATFKPNKGSKAVVTATYTDKDGATVIVHQTVRLVKVVNTFKFEEKIGSKKWKTFKGASVDVDVSGTPIIKIKLLGKHGPTTSIMWNALASVSGEEIIKVNEYGNICVIAPQKIGTCQLMVSDFAGNSTLLTVNVVADLKVVDDEPQTAKVSDFIEIG